MDDEGTTRFSLVQSATSKTLVLAIGGEIDAVTSRAAGTKLHYAVAGLPPPDVVVVDLSAVTFFSAAGVRMLAKVHRSCVEHHVTLRIVAADHTIVQRVLLIAGLDRDAAVFATLAAALAA